MKDKIECTDKKGHVYPLGDEAVVLCENCGGAPMTSQELMDDMSGTYR